MVKIYQSHNRLKEQSDCLIAAIYDGSICLCEHSDTAVNHACGRIHDMISCNAEELIAILAESNIDSRRRGPSRHYNQFVLEVQPQDAGMAIKILEKHHFQRWAPLERGALRCYLEHYRSMLLIRDREHTMRVLLRWGEKRIMPRVFVPSIKSLSCVDLPTYAWPVYYLLRPFYLLSSRLRGTHHVPEVRPFLGTPNSLLIPLFQLADLNSDDVFVDIGCGDGRVVIEASRKYNCRSIGIEYLAEIADRARTAIQQSGLQERVSILQGDALNADLNTATVVFMFLPMSSWSVLLPKILKKVNPGTRVVAHELHPLDDSFSPYPNQSTAVIGRDAITVAHMWIAQ